MGSEQPSIIESGGDGGRLDWLAEDRPVVRGAGLGCALAGFGALIAAQLLPWVSMATTPLQQDFPTTSGGRLERGFDELPVATEIFKLGWLLVLAAVAAALAVRASARRTAVATGLGLVAGQVALLAGMTKGLKHNGVFRGNLTPADLPVQFESGLYCAYAALLLFALALLFADGVPRWLRRRVADGPAVAEYGPVDLTVAAAPPTGYGPAAPATDPAMWSRQREGWPPTDIEVGGRQSER